jgi:hypothetical protein
MIWGNQASVLVGDFLLGQAFKMMVEVGSLEALDVLSTAAAVIAEGEVLQLSVAKNMETTEDDYLSVIRAKTAALFSAACEVGPIIAETGKAERNALRSYGINLGLAFQLIDDVLDYGGSAMIWARMSAMTSARARSPAGGAGLPARFGSRTRVLARGDRGRQERRCGAGKGARPDHQIWQPERHHGAGRALCIDCARRARAAA